MTLKELNDLVKPGDNLVKFTGAKRTFYRIYRKGRKLCTISKNQYELLEQTALFLKYNLYGTKRTSVY